MIYKGIISFWFEELTEAHWWKKDEALDQKIREKYLHLYTKAINGELSLWRKQAEGRLAEIIVIDQFARNIFRGDARAFRYDTVALVLAQSAIQAGADQALPPQKRAFMYLPFMHSESKIIHEAAVKLFEQDGMENNLSFEHAHKVIIDRFGRYPHRNELLDRQSTVEELEFLKEPGSRF